MSLGQNVRISSEEELVEDYIIDRYLYPEYFDCYNADEIFDYRPIYDSESGINYVNVDSEKVVNLEEPTKPLVGPMDSPWPMYCHDVRHTGRSPYSTADNKGFEKWQLSLQGLVWGSPVIDDDGILYIGAWDFYAIYPNGTIKWNIDISAFSSAAAIDENGVLYVGSIWAHPNYLYAIYANNGTLKWKFKTDSHISSSPTIGIDGTVYFGSEDHGVYAVHPNGTLKWKFTANHIVFSSLAIGLDGTTYFGSIDNYIYAVYPNNGTLKWKFNTGTWVHGSATIGEDGIVYIGSDNGYLYAFYPNNGTVKWRCSVGYIWGSPALDENGNIYVGTWGMKFFAVYSNGTIKWRYDAPGRIWFGTSAAISADGTIYFGTSTQDGGKGSFIALNPDGIEKWKKSFGLCESSPAIGEDGTVYIGGGGDDGRLFAFGYPGPNPLTPDIDGPTSGKPGTSYTYTFTSIDPDEDQVSYYIDWDDGNITDWTGFQPSGNPYSESHTYSTKGTYTVKAKAKDTDGYESDWGALTVSMPRNKATNEMLLLRFLEQFPLLREVLSRLIPR